MNKEVPLKERIEKLLESGWVNEFNYLESQILEARSLVVILQQKVEEKDKEIDRLKDLCNKYEEEHNTAFKLWTQKMEEMPDYEEKMELKKEVVKLNNIINELENIMQLMIYQGYCAKTGKGTTATNFMATGENSEFGTRAKYVLDKLKELKNGDNNE